MVPEEIKKIKKDTLLAENGCFREEIYKLNLKIQNLKKLTDVQEHVIGQLKGLLRSTNQTKFQCAYGHYSCKIDHKTYNFFKPLSQSENKLLSKSYEPSSIKSIKLNQENMQIKSMVRKLDKLQAFYGMPPVVEKNETTSWIEPEFGTIWENVLFFAQNVLNMAVKKTDLPQFNSSLPKVKYVHRSVILESRPMKFAIKRKVSKPKIPKQMPSYQPMTDDELAVALALDKSELEEAFACNDRYDAEEGSFDGAAVLQKVFDDDLYQVDVDGLNLLSDGELPSRYGYDDNNSKSIEDLAAAHGYNVSGPRNSDSSQDETDGSMTAETSNPGDNLSASLEELAAAHGYCDDGPEHIDSGQDTEADDECDEVDVSEADDEVDLSDACSDSDATSSSGESGSSVDSDDASYTSIDEDCTEDSTDASEEDVSTEESSLTESE